MRGSPVAPLVSLDGVYCGYGADPALVDASLCIEPGQFTGVVGPSGAGKTTLLRAVMGTLRPIAGTVRPRPGLRVAYVPQVETIDWSFPVTVGEAVLMARTRGRRLPWASRSERAELDEILSRLGIGELAGRHIRELSGGQQQRVFIARALMQGADLLLLDEPTAGVDLKLRHEILHLLLDLSHEGIGIVLTTHDLNGVATHLPRLVCLNREVIAVGPPIEVLRPEILARTYGAGMDVLQHGGVCVVVDAAGVSNGHQHQHRHSHAGEPGPKEAVL